MHFLKRPGRLAGSMLAVEFLGGPIDGHVQLFTVRLEPFLFVKPKPPGFWQRLAMRLLGRGLPARPVAIYELEQGRCRYRYVCSQPAGVRTGPKIAG